MTRYIALYLPQFHPIPENDEWYGKGFTEWTNVAKAKPLFRGHYQPHVPADLGFYDLRLKEIRREQARMAQEAGVSAFCYWDYWFGDGKKLLEMPLDAVHDDPEITLPFCIAWANHSWEKKMWDKQGNNEMLMEQKYLGIEDYSAYFYRMLPIFRDDRYFRVNDRPFVIVYSPLESSEIGVYLKCWRELANKEGLGDFYFVGRDAGCRNVDRILDIGFDAVYEDDVFNIHHELGLAKKIALYLKRRLFGRPTVFQYRDAIKHMVPDEAKRREVIPVIAPNWDHSPRSGRNAILLDNCEPKYFQQVAEHAREVVSAKPDDEQIVIIKAWNEWGEGNHMEPDLRYGTGYLDALRDSLRENLC